MVNSCQFVFNQFFLVVVDKAINGQLMAIRVQLLQTGCKLRSRQAINGQFVAIRVSVSCRPV